MLLRKTSNKVYSKIIYDMTWQFNPPTSQFKSLCNEFSRVWSMFPNTIKTCMLCNYIKLFANPNTT